MYGYRKLAASVLAFAVSTTLLMLHYLQSSDWATFNTFQIGFFFGANVTAKIFGPGSSTD